LLLLVAAQQTGLLGTLIATIMEVAGPSALGWFAQSPEVVARLVLTLLFLPVAGLARTWDLRGYTGTMLALLTGRERAYSQRYTERFLADLARTQASARLTEGLAKWTWSLWGNGSVLAVCYVDGHRKAVYSDVLVPRGPIGKLGGKILGCRELVVLHDALGHPLLILTYRGDQHLTIGLPSILKCYEQAIGSQSVQLVVVDREGMAAEFLAHQLEEGRKVVTLLKANQYEAESSFEQVGEWRPLRSNRKGQVICEVASARLLLSRPDPADPQVSVEVALVRDWRKERANEESDETTDQSNWLADLNPEQRQFWEDGWQASPLPPAQTAPKLIPVITTGKGMDAVKLAQTYFERWNCQENAIRDWLIPLNLDTNHGYAKEQVVNSELTKRQEEVQRRVQRLQRLAQASRVRLSQLLKQQGRLQEQIRASEQRRNELLAKVRAFEETGQVHQRGYASAKARQLAVERQVHRYNDRLQKNAQYRELQMGKCERYCQELRQVLRRQEDLQAQARNMYELDHSKDQIMTLLKMGLANLGMWVRDHYFGESYQHCGWQRLLPFFKLGGRITETAQEVQIELCAFNNRALDRDLEEVCRRVNSNQALLPDGRRVVLTIGKRLCALALNTPLTRSA
jgi:hypothetical protein